MRRRKFSEAATIKAKARRLARDMEELLADKTLPDGLRRQVEELRVSLRKTWGQLEKEAGQEKGRKGVAQQEETGEAMAKTKTVAGKQIPASSFLVVEDPNSPSTFHLQVKDETGKPDHRLMGAAWAALNSPNGYRGNKYEGPNAGKAKAALKKMYDDEGMPYPAENAEAEEVAEYGYEFASCYVPTNIISFAQLDTAEAAQEIAHEMREAVEQFQQMLQNIFFWAGPDQVPDKISAAQSLFDEFVGVMGDILAGDGEGDAIPMAGGESSTPDPAPISEGEAVSMAESYEPTVTVIEEDAAANPRGPLEMDVQLIKPGWGNSRDNHYYPAEMLKRDAHIFETAKMYTTDHVSSEKSERTEVSQIKQIIGFTEEGAPIARVIVFDPNFAEKCRNRKKAGLLESLECSILADGKARPGFEEGGRKGKVVEAITAVSSVDWVTRAGAGGKALSLAENDAQPEQEAAPVEEAAPTEPVTIHEQDEQPTEETPAAEPVQETTPPEPVYLGEAEIREALGKTNLPAASVLTLYAGKYETAQALQEAVSAEIKRIKEVTGSGRPFAMGESKPDNQAPVSQAQIEETMDKINKKFGFGR